MTLRLISLLTFVCLSSSAWSVCECRTFAKPGIVSLMVKTTTGERVITSFPFKNIEERRAAQRQCFDAKRTSLLCQRQGS